VRKIVLKNPHANGVIKNHINITNMKFRVLSIILIQYSLFSIHYSMAAPAEQRVTEGNASSTKPNIVHIMIDDLGWQDIAAHKIDGKPVYETPHMDRMTKIGRRFTQAYSPAPTCAPSRVSFLRGQHPVHTGVVAR